MLGPIFGAILPRDFRFEVLAAIQKDSRMCKLSFKVLYKKNLLMISGS